MRWRWSLLGWVEDAAACSQPAAAVGASRAAGANEPTSRVTLNAPAGPKNNSGFREDERRLKVTRINNIQRHGYGSGRSCLLAVFQLQHFLLTCVCVCGTLTVAVGAVVVVPRLHDDGERSLKQRSEVRGAAKGAFILKAEQTEPLLTSLEG